MMGLLDRLNRVIAGRATRDRARIAVEGDMLFIERHSTATVRAPVTAVTRATLLHRDVYAGDGILLRLAFADGLTADIFSDDRQWRALVAALDRSGRTATLSAEWQLQALADGPGAPPRELI